MSNYEQIGALYDKSGKLLGVRYSLFDADSDRKDWVDAVEMRFERAVATVYVESEFDTLRLELNEMKLCKETPVIITLIGMASSIRMYLSKEFEL